MGYYVKLYLVALVAYLAVDLVWLGFVARSLYQRYLAFLLGPTQWSAALSVYLLLILGIVVFAIVPGLKENSLKMTLLRAALFGLIAYGTYDLTNLATLRNWPLLITLVDMAWGTTLSAIVACVGFWVGRQLG